MKQILRMIGLAAVTGLAVSAPAQLTATNHLAIWLKADAGAATNDSGHVLSWTDQSGRGNDATADEAPYGAKPALVANGLNGQPILRFDSPGEAGPIAGAHLVLTNHTINLSQGLSIFIVASNADRRNFNGLFRLGPGVPFAVGGASGSMSTNGLMNDDLEIYWQEGQGSTTNSGNLMYVVNVAAGTNSPNGQLFGYDAGPATNQYYLYDVVATPVDAHQRIDGADAPGAPPAGTRFTPTNTVSTAAIGIGYTGLYTYVLHGAIAEVLVYDDALSSTDRQAVENYLSRKWFVPAGSAGAKTVLPDR